MLDVLKKEKKTFESIKLKIIKSLENAPEGKLRISKCKSRTTFYHVVDSNDSNGRYLNKRDIKLTKALFQKRYDMKMLDIVNLYLEKIGSIIAMMEENPLVISGIDKKMIKSYFVDDIEYAEQWASISYKGKSNALYNYVTKRGEKVRSKSELIIADRLYEKRIPYRYEYPYETENGTYVYPDFTVLNSRTRKEFIFEHFGLMNNKEYVEQMIKKIKMYCQMGYFPGNNLIITFETSDNPLDTDFLDKIIKHYLL